MTDGFAKAYLAALAVMEQNGMPDALHETAAFLGRKDGVSADDDSLRAHLAGSDKDDELRMQLHLRLAKWDNLDEASWTEGTEPHTDQRRALVVRLLEVDDLTGKMLAEQFPIAGKDDDIVIADEDDWQPWYTEELRKKRDFYWKSYQGLLTRKGWEPEAIAALDQATDEVVERLSDPTRVEAYQAKGLVVGYVQSGKTANFTGVVAKAIDAGYRLVIVLTGTTDLLRNQTQRRLDMELIGVENILGGADPDDQAALDDVDYQDDPDWIDGKFLSHGVKPNDADRPAIHRLTRYAGDYKSLKHGIEALNFLKVDKALPFYDPTNLHPADAKVAIVKKNSTVLTKLVNDLHKISAKLGHIPVLIIDDESDQASVNTSNPKKWLDDQKERTAINRLIARLLRDLPRAQYVGYTATPFANVFIDPSDAEDIFPKDFLISLRRAPGYVGAADFHDLDAELDDVERTFATSREKAHVRFVLEEGGEDDKTLLRAIDTFVLTGAMKLYREAEGIHVFRHHTMLVHEAMRTAKHKEQADRIRSLWKKAGYYSAASRDRLRGLFDADVRPVAEAVGQGLPTPVTFDELLPYVSDAVARIGQTDPVIVVNSDKDAATEDLDFDRRPVWRILVGGNKLARGFTVEGLTVSYFLRKTAMADAMMQMGRWFGFRQNYKDLVRLYISPNLYDGFEAIVRDEEFFRNELRRYATRVDGEPQVTPRQIPPLVAQHIPWLKPTASNKMYNVELVERRSPGVGLEPTGYPKDPNDLQANTEAMLPLIEAATDRVLLHSSPKSTYPALMGTISQGGLLDVLGALRWFEPEHFAPDLRWLRRLGPEKVEDWAVILPQHVRGTEAVRMLMGHGPLSLFRRRRRRDPYFGALSEPRHRRTAARIVGLSTEPADVEADKWARPRRGAFLLYPVIETDPPVAPEINSHQVIMVFHLLAPAEATASDGRLVTFKTRDSRKARAAIVDAD
ncbi:Z1 domain-containing protein [Actinomadura rudentiformis]|uniref:Z1 domain-containing protein n=1 Tax=Actinomadura rudentiformis TaxID=359158 RepID=A0A6H9YAP9_9ACTN|nr:Z1 domain-containing protein [Actinomadura rudentiformis]KAB2340888.1 Z1 domain-containing protein [Actinomadura rudentiformis]